jgi:hypothetical protein
MAASQAPFDLEREMKLQPTITSAPPPPSPPPPKDVVFVASIAASSGAPKRAQPFSGRLTSSFGDHHYATRTKATEVPAESPRPSIERLESRREQLLIVSFCVQQQQQQTGIKSY